MLGHAKRFNPRPRAGGDTTTTFCSSSTELRHVSIRAPARGATWILAFSVSLTRELVSIRAPARGATMGCPMLAIGLPGLRFNPRPRAGGDLVCSLDELERRSHVSIRAPARGATAGAPTGTLRGACFNPRPRAGGDDRHPRRSVEQTVSIRAPARGATARDRAEDLSTSRAFQSAPPRGGRPSITAIDAPRRSIVSIRAPARGATTTDD